MEKSKCSIPTNDDNVDEDVIDNVDEEMIENVDDEVIENAEKFGGGDIMVTQWKNGKIQMFHSPEWKFECLIEFLPF